MKNTSLRLRALTVLAALALATTGAFAAETYKIDKVHSSVGFKVRHIVSNVTGSFVDFSGTLVLDEADFTKSSVEAVIQTTSINTNNGDRDNHLRSEEYFDAAKFPTITFKSKKVEGTKDALRVTGDFTMHGVTKEITLDAAFLGTMDTKMGKKAGFSATGQIVRSEFGVSSGTPMVGDDVKILIEIEANPPRPEKPVPPPPPPAEPKAEPKKK